MKKVVPFTLIAACAMIAFVLLQPDFNLPVAKEDTPASQSVTIPEPDSPPASSFVVRGPDPIRQGLVGAGLNAANGTTREDLRILQGVFRAWQRRAKDVGNPVGSNREITAALTGRNQWRLAFLPRDHPAINARGELCDRWGTPLYFHQLSGTQMEVRSHGPDRIRFTADDVVL